MTNDNDNDNRNELISLNEFDEIDENDIELGDEDEDERPFPDSDEAIRALQDVAEAVDEMEAECHRLRAELKTALAERDEARKMCCELEARIIVLEEDRRDTSNKFGTNPCSEIILADSPLARYPKEIAKRKGWDCFKEDCK